MIHDIQKKKFSSYHPIAPCSLQDFRPRGYLWMRYIFTYSQENQLCATDNLCDSSKCVQSSLQFEKNVKIRRLVWRWQTCHYVGCLDGRHKSQLLLLCHDCKKTAQLNIFASAIHSHRHGHEHWTVERGKSGTMNASTFNLCGMFLLCFGHSL